ncbi:hypothetical protein ACN93_12890 [Gordonia paraffinivorans]|uniref:hypothetical protein n=1 Tax=Gordonia paraffinivorans TaxID=175628 RepID=UPI000D607B7B|nr:hypothetical protein [Gordonia paraffinivorans]PWD42498.1 hypothetical protein ACN93_12890 [Gordonia paraffinivorans]
MRRGVDSLSTLRQDAHAGVAELIEFLGAGRLMGLAGPEDATIRTGLQMVDAFDIAALSADARALVAAHRAVSDQLHHLPEQRVRLDDGWRSAAATQAVDAVIGHQRRAESDLYVLHTLTDATAAAASGIDRLMRSFDLAVARLGTPIAAETPPAELPEAVLGGRVPLGVVAEDLRSRVELFTSCVDATVRGITGILEILNRSLDGIDAEPYPGGEGVTGSTESAGSTEHSVPRSVPVGPADLAAVDSVVGETASAVAVPVPGEEPVPGGGEPGRGEDVPFQLGGAVGTHGDDAVTAPDTGVPQDVPAHPESGGADPGSGALESGGPDSERPDPERAEFGRPDPERPDPERPDPEISGPDGPQPVSSSATDPSPEPERSAGDLALAGDQ